MSAPVVVEYIESLKTAHPDLLEKYTQFLDLYRKKYEAYDCHDNNVLTPL